MLYSQGVCPGMSHWRKFGISSLADNMAVQEQTKDAVYVQENPDITNSGADPNSNEDKNDHIDYQGTQQCVNCSMMSSENLRAQVVTVSNKTDTEEKTREYRNIH
eukprot:TRINITY_DN5694_c0_g1_i2.p1 TRINITY_DN5694_c0_g1~~TRINITY_DN5694_c0_g1_i2.p1  ORF type:complete len:105 (-),score=20.85 TRINITY_DN5694_c0_g1_i2:165-479(-)